MVSRLQSSLDDYEIAGTKTAIWKPTPGLRWLMRDGERVLQQQFDVIGTAGFTQLEWRDVPLAEISMRAGK